LHSTLVCSHYDGRRRIDEGVDDVVNGSRIVSAPGSSKAIRGAAALYGLLGLGFGIGTIVTLSHLARHSELPMTPWGFRSLAGPFEQLGSGRFTALGWSLVVVCALDIVTAIWLVQGRRRGLRLGLATSLPAFGLALGFALPFLLLGIPIRVALALAGRRNLR
jgi:hypothetical protein